MRKITLFYDGAWYTFKWLKAMLWAQNEFKELGYEVSFLNQEEFLPSRDKVDTFEGTALNYEYDIVFIAHHDSHIGFCSIENERFAELMKKLRKRCNMIVWLDTSDSTGTLWKNAFPFIDLYFKKQVLADRDRYLEKMWGGRIYTQYYHERGNIDDAAVEEREALTEEEIKKIRVSWNVGLGDLFAEKELSYERPHEIYTPELISPNVSRQYDIQYKGTLDYSFCGYQRLRSTQLIDGSSLKHSDVFSKIPYEDYLKEISESKAVISPYGWGEICTRDFEAFLLGSVLIKPDMGHLTTWPEWYAADETYVPVKWDFSDFIEVIDNTVNSNNYSEIAQNAQNLLKHYRCTGLGKREFAKHIVTELER